MVETKSCSLPLIPASSYQQVVEFDLDAHGDGQSFIQGESWTGDQDVVPWVAEDADGQLNGLAAAAGQNHVLEGQKEDASFTCCFYQSSALM